ncbi:MULTISPECIES: UDP-N-acetylmuramate:L-alanyl-gamma-D-glutamyl-meso-diaminopimelate ligase [unclassified Oceanobacter]|jgi:UDP-N-acetylmuramate: L-alanyl-gamma-D-glutamyl-meso-diaminopimelate ligase|uniref:UDP-N-acetylmuramate:L-alanyl-gamma-D-glutamyl- meso-diaminopimelate ligase n=1 Tax=unclassified Oceanobacter TaxID=2620260 RepID=UPI00273749A0|nr:MULTISPECIES: UDP-N-acetylmuramate:L-alanyl-gamma-D-glutamyl-meso-diaminopimelate ligase [unclassified Oceanobacter]MDP2608212.1 UDP-N-acetylmuramate:L-alanyl-gamma-D-glutamyl-meso-diaminopimelate ligase [Oceanobacter sp. 1_MG-2023]MDP2612938.1 UDP-N-acetylmuramate:L-alanyl-gamma-D-glutamyl-meso-diaminopimelate ligase [Oceanobacter sp. 2_MG-2023]
MRVHILGICGTFMGSLAQLAKALGHQVSGSDHGVYPPMSEQLAAAGIELIEGFDPAAIPVDTDLVIIGNAMSRGNPSVEYVLERGLPYCSGPQWMNQHLLQGRWVAAVAGTHGKTSTASMLAWILECAGMAPGFLIGGVPGNFPVSARLGDSPFFVIEADEYDTAFFDKRSKFVHYLPRTVIMNNLEFDHADIFDNLAAIERQFHHLVRLVPASGRIILPRFEPALERVLAQGCWSDVERFGEPTGWHVRKQREDGGEFSLWQGEQCLGQVQWTLNGDHNVNNACAAVLAARHMGVRPEQALEALASFRLPRRRMECLADTGQVSVYDDFAHHPTAIKTTLAGARAAMPAAGRLIAVLEPRSNTMKMGLHKDTLLPAVADADLSFWLEAEGQGWSLAERLPESQGQCFHGTEALLAHLQQHVQSGDRVVFMSNGGFSGLPARFARWLTQQAESTPS